MTFSFFSESEESSPCVEKDICAMAFIQAEQASTSGDTSSVVSLDNVSAESPNFLGRSNSENPLQLKNWFMLNVRISS